MSSPTLGQLMWGGSVTHHGEIGLEIETEAKRNYDVPNDVYTYWNVQEDGSLRDIGREFVFRQPYNYNSDEYRKALASFETLSENVKFQKSVYSSVHVHFNQVDRTLPQIANFICLYLLCEEVLTRYCGPDRDGNLFCLKVSNAEQTWHSVRNLFANMSNWQNVGYRSPKDAVGTLREDNLKYSSINVATLRTIGSVEIRTHGGTTDVVDIDRWISILYRLYDLAKSFENPTRILKLFKYWDQKRIFNKFFGEYAEFLDLTNLEKDTKAALYYVGTIASSVKDWSKLGYVEKVAAPKRKRKVNTGINFSVEEVRAVPTPITRDTVYYQRLLNEMAAAQPIPTHTGWGTR